MSDELTGTAPPTFRSKEGRFNLADRVTIMGLVGMTVIIVMLFVIFVVATGLLHHQMSARLGLNPFDQSYIETATGYRQERKALLMTYRTFMVTLGFTVGLAICSIGALFAVRCALSRSKSPPRIAGAKRLSLAIAANSPGIVFMLAGVITIFVVQYLTPPIVEADISPTGMRNLCAPDQDAPLHAADQTCQTLIEFRTLPEPSE